ncbi:MAG: FecR domain-containing protein, partial [Candidatus Omnitrophota bacterium]
MKKIFCLACGFAVLFGMAQQGFCEESKRAAKIIEVKGDVSIKHPKGKWMPAEVGIELNEGDVVRTKANSSALLNVDGEGETATVTVKENSQLFLSQLVVDKEKATQKTLLDLALGEVSIKAEKVHSKDSKFQVKTPTSVVGVRGTEFTVEVEALD